MSEILCPNCGHHIADIRQVKASKSAAWETFSASGRVDHVERFLSSLERDEAALRIPATQLYLSYERWCREQGIEPLTTNRLSHVLIKTHGVSRTKSNSTRYYVLPGA